MQIGIVAIGRNEGERLRTCLTAARVRKDAAIVYVDSGSTDGSRDLARSFGAEVVELDLSIPFTAARARNEGFQRLISKNPDLQFVQFLDGDCELDAHWIDKSLAEFEKHPKAAIICGRRRERFPERSIYNHLCDLEWDTPIGQAKYCGGDTLMRVKPFLDVDGYNPSVIAGEEPEMCVRIRRAGWEIYRIDAEMTLHDAAMSRFSQWWKRNVRAGHAYAEGAHMHGKPPESHWVKEVKSNWVWGLLLPLIAIIPAYWTHGWSLLLLGMYVVLGAKIYKYARTRYDAPVARLYSIFIVIGKIPQMLGQLKYATNRLTGRKSKIIEYKHIAPGGQAA